MGTCCVIGLQSKSRESQAGSPCMGTAHPFLRAAQCSGAGTCSRSRVGGLRRPALRARTLESIRKRGPARYPLAAASHTGAPGSGGGGDLLPGGCASTSTGHSRPGGAGGCSAQWGGRGILPGPWGAIFFREPGASAWGGRGVLPRGCSESPARPRGGHRLPRTGRTGPGGNGVSCPRGVWSLLPGQGGAIFF